MSVARLRSITKPQKRRRLFRDQNITALPPLWLASDGKRPRDNDVSPFSGMNLTINNDDRVLTIDHAGGRRDVPLYSREAFEAISREWVRIGWSLRYYHTFSWFGRPILQLPEDLVRLQEVIYEIRPDAIVETRQASMVWIAGSCSMRCCSARRWAKGV